MARNVNAAKERLAFADESITRARELVAEPTAGKQGELIDCVRGAESALQQASSMLDAVDSAASDIRKAVSTLPAAITDIQNGINQAATQLAQGELANATELIVYTEIVVMTRKESSCSSTFLSPRMVLNSPRTRFDGRCRLPRKQVRA